LKPPFPPLACAFGTPLFPIHHAEGAKAQSTQREERGRIFTTEGNSELHGEHGVKKNPLPPSPLYVNILPMNRTLAKTAVFPQTPTQKMPQPIFFEWSKQWGNKEFST